MVSDPHYFGRLFPILEKDGIPDVGSDEIRLHKPPKRTVYIQTDTFAASFRLQSGQPIALLEQLWSDDEHTHITGRTGIVIDLKKRKPIETKLWFERSSNNHLACVLTWLEAGQDVRRRAINLTQRKKEDGWEDKLVTLRRHFAAAAPIAARLLDAASAMGIEGIEARVAEYRKTHLPRLHTSCQLVGK